MTCNQKPLIGITTYGRNDQYRFTLPALYVDSIRRAGGIPLLIAPGENHLDDILNRLDGVMLAGGGDLNPTTYNGKRHEMIYNIDKERDTSELRIGELILSKKMPTLAICRGIQIINTILGGTLFEHIPDHFGETVQHRLPPRAPSRHSVTIDKNSNLFKLVQKQEIEVTSLHHQSIDKLAEGLSIVAKSADGVIEAIEFKDEPWFIGIQWHPEYTSAEDPNQQILFETLVQRSKLKLAATSD